MNPYAGLTTFVDTTKIDTFIQNAASYSHHEIRVNRANLYKVARDVLPSLGDKWKVMAELATRHWPCHQSDHVYAIDNEIMMVSDYQEGRHDKLFGMAKLLNQRADPRADRRIYDARLMGPLFGVTAMFPMSNCLDTDLPSERYEHAELYKSIAKHMYVELDDDAAMGIACDGYQNCDYDETIQCIAIQWMRRWRAAIVIQRAFRLHLQARTRRRIQAWIPRMVTLLISKAQNQDAAN